MWQKIQWSIFVSSTKFYIFILNFWLPVPFLFGNFHILYTRKTRRKVLKVAKIKDANHDCKDEGIDDWVIGQ